MTQGINIPDGRSFYDPSQSEYQNEPWGTSQDNTPFRTDDDFDPDACNDPEARAHIDHLMGIPR